MPSNGTLASIASRTASKVAPRTGPSIVARVEDVRIRNYDPRPHQLSLRVTGPDGPALDETYELTPEVTVSLLDELDEGHYEVEAVMDETSTATASCEVAADPAGTILVEMGNGVVAVSNGY